MLKILCLLFLTSTLNAQKVYKTPSGAKYHLSSCRTVKNVSEAITLKDAAALGLQPCKVCKPALMKAQAAAPKKASGQAETLQCKGITRAGTRCRHQTRIANGYCFQHQP